MLAHLMHANARCIHTLIPCSHFLSKQLKQALRDRVKRNEEAVRENVSASAAFLKLMDDPHSGRMTQERAKEIHDSLLQWCVVMGVCASVCVRVCTYVYIKIYIYICIRVSVCVCVCTRCVRVSGCMQRDDLSNVDS